MQRRNDDAQRRIAQNEQYPPRVIPASGQRFGDESGLAGLTFPINYQINQHGSHHGPVPGSLSHTVGIGSTGPVTGATLHSGHQPGITANQSMLGPPLSGGQQQQQQQQQCQRLKVEDALSYLDQVKLQFGNQPQVYNDFLDIMKEFKSQTIDTPGVINRVSNLFNGHRDLIVGFNTFLPPGYKIEVQCETINVHQPGQQVMSIAALAQSQAASNVNRQKSGMSIWDVALATQQKVSSAHHNPLPVPTPAPAADHRSYHQSPRPQAEPTPPTGPPLSQPQPPQQQSQQPQAQQQQQQQQPGGQPVEFNHAINYVNKIKNRFQGQPDIYKQFLEILHTYQKEQRLTRDGGNVGPSKPLTESEVYQQVANLFKHQEDLLAEFGQFLPDANGASSYGVASFISRDKLFIEQAESTLGVRNDHNPTVKKPGYTSGKTQTNKTGTAVKRPATAATAAPASSYQPPVKKKGVPKDFSLADASKTGTLTEYAFFDKVRKALRHQEVYDNFLRSIVLFNQEIVTKQELVTLVSFFLSKFPDLFREFRDLLGVNEQGGGIETVPHGAAQKERISGELAMEIDFNTCKRYGASYRGIPNKFVPPKCSGRTALCREVLNDTWVSFPTWSEDSSFVTSRKTQYEENIYKCEDERFELDYVIETNFSTIKSLEAVLKKINRMPQEEAAKFRLDNTLGGTSECINRNSIHRIYGDKSSDIIEGLKKNPVVAVPLVLRRLKAKDEEWREAQKQFNKLWKEQNEKFYLKSLDHQCANFKQHDIKAIRGKSLLNQIETIYDERADSEEAPPQGPMLTFVYEDRLLIEDAGNLIIHHVKRQTGVDKEAKTRIKQLVKHFVPDLFFAPRGELSDDDGEVNEDMDVDEEDSAVNVQRNSDSSKKAKDKSSQEVEEKKKKVNGVKSESAEESVKNIKKEDEEGESEKNGGIDGNEDDHDRYTLFYCNSTWYIFLRLHQILCSRLLKAYSLKQKLMAEEAVTKKERKESVALALRLRSPLEVEVEDYYSYFLDMIRAVLDGNMESSQYEDTMREMFGIEAYQLFTMDKVVQNIVRQVQHLVMDDMPVKLAKLFEEQKEKGGAGGRWATRHQRNTLEQAYLRQAELILMDDNPFKFVIRSLTAQMEIDMLDPPPESNDSVKETSTWSSYLTEYTTTKKNEEFMHRVGNSRPVYLVRNKKKNPDWESFKKQHEMNEELEEEEEEEEEEVEKERVDQNSENKKRKERDSSAKVKTESNQDSELSEKEKSPTDNVTQKSSDDADADKTVATPATTVTDDYDDENIDDAAALARSSRIPMGGDDDDDDKRGGAESDGGLGDDEDDDDKGLESASKRKKIGSSPDGLSRRVHSIDNTSVKFQHNSYHHMFVKNTGLVMYKCARLARTNESHKQVTQKKYANMLKWVDVWLAKNVTSTQSEECRKWLLGLTTDSRSNKTYVTEIEQHDKTPYRVFRKYSVDWVAPGAGRTSPANNS
uniref:Paired amphipathic helix protein Sin3a n=1 Tax=Biomphalaria glabrata TaxID=6526 RepID=A0A2C9K1L6_BIOGL